MSNISDMVLKKEAAWKDEDYRNAAMNIALPVGGAAAGYGLTNALVDDASTGMKIGGAGLGAAAALITSLYLQNMDKGTVPADAPPVKPSEKAEQELKDVASDWSPRGAIGLGLGIGAGGVGTYGAYRGLKGMAKTLSKDFGTVSENAGVKAGQGISKLIGSGAEATGKGTSVAAKGVAQGVEAANDWLGQKLYGGPVKKITDAVRDSNAETWKLRDIIKLIKKVKKVAP